MPVHKDMQTLQNKRNNVEQNFEASLAIIEHQSMTIIIKTNIEHGTESHNSQEHSRKQMKAI